MDFINNHIRRMNSSLPHNFEINTLLPRKNLSELEQLNDQIFASIKARSYNLLHSDKDHSHQSFEKLVNQIQGKNVSSVSDLTGDFQKTIKKNFSDL